MSRNYARKPVTSGRYQFAHVADYYRELANRVTLLGAKSRHYSWMGMAYAALVQNGERAPAVFKFIQDNARG